MTKASRCLMDIICKPHHHWTRHNVAAPSFSSFFFLLTCLSHTATFCCRLDVVSHVFFLALYSTLSFLFFFPKWPLGNILRDVPKLERFLETSPRFVFYFCQWGLLCLKCYHSFTGRIEKKHLQPIAMHLTETKHFLTLTLGM